MNIDNDAFAKKLEESDIQIHKLENENYELIKHKKNLILSQDNIQKEIVKQNQNLTFSEQKLKEQISKNIQELDYIKEERENLKKIMSEAVTKCSSLIKEKNELERELINKTNQIDNLKNSNQILHKNIVKTNLSTNKNNSNEENKT